MSMEEKNVDELVKSARTIVRTSIILALATMTMVFVNTNPELFSSNDSSENEDLNKKDRDLIEDGIHVRTGLIDAEGMFVVIGNCTNCHSAKLVTQNRMTAERWNETIKWMQETQNLWDLGENQEIIVNYLVTNYPPKKSGMRRSNLTDIEWYETEN